MIADRFVALCQRVGIPEKTALAAFSYLTGKYAEEHRKYHNLLHIERMLGWLDHTGQALDSIELAIWFHDVIYDPLGRDNEEKSALSFVEHCGISLPAAITDGVVRLILATDASRPRTGKPDENLMIDLDLSILGASPEDYEVYRIAIRSEYAAVAEEKFRAGRRVILERFLSQPIYSTHYFEDLEKQARINIETELTQFLSPPYPSAEK